MRIRITFVSMLLFFSLLSFSQPPLQFVNTLSGTASATSADPKMTGTEQFRHTIPAVGRPFGMTQWTPETRIGENRCTAPYYYNDRYITGFRGSHWTGSSCSRDWGSATLMPFTASRPDTLKSPPASKFSHRNEFASPSYYRLLLDNSGITAEMTGSLRSGMIRLTFTGKTPGFILIRMNNGEKQGIISIDSQGKEIAGYNPVLNPGEGGNSSTGFGGFFIIRFDKPVKAIEQLRDNQQLVVSVGTEKTINIKIGTSFSGYDAARINLGNEIPAWDFEGLKKSSEDSWNQTLGKIQLRGGNDEERTEFYTALYRFYLFPHLSGNTDGTFRIHGRDTNLMKAEGFNYYDDFFHCDSCPAYHSLMSILEPSKAPDMVNSLILKVLLNRWMPVAGGPGSDNADSFAGEIAARSVFSKLGFYPAGGHEGRYIITVPAFDEVKIIHPGGRIFLITSLNRSPGTNYIRAITKEGGRYTDKFIRNNDLMTGSRFTFQLDSKPLVK